MPRIFLKSLLVASFALSCAGEKKRDLTAEEKSTLTDWSAAMCACTKEADPKECSNLADKRFESFKWPNKLELSDTSASDFNMLQGTGQSCRNAIWQ